jgi:hypothetical protein
LQIADCGLRIAAKGQPSGFGGSVVNVRGADEQPL